MKKLVLVGIITLALNLSARASDLTGAHIGVACEANLPAAKRDNNTEKYANFCNTYINGWEDAIFAFLKGSKTYCPPAITIKEMSVVLVAYLNIHEEALRIPAAEALMRAFKDKWPCR